MILMLTRLQQQIPRIGNVLAWTVTRFPMSKMIRAGHRYQREDAPPSPTGIAMDRRLLNTPPLYNE